MRTIEVKIYTFEELSEEAKQKAREKYEPDYYWYSPVFVDFEEKCAKYGLNVKYKDISFSGFWSQGDGASFTCDDIDIPKLLESLNITFKHRLDHLFAEYISVYIKRTSSHYCHENTVTAYVDTDTCYLHAPTIEDYFLTKGEELEKKLENLKNDLCQQLYRDLENYYEDITSEEYIDADYIEGGWEFYEDGSFAERGE